MSDVDSIRRCIAGTMRAKDKRGGYANQIALYRRLLPDTTPTIAMMTAQAARRVGEAIAARSRA